MPFLEKNSIVVDASIGSVIDRTADFHLVHEISNKQHQPGNKHRKVPSAHTGRLTTRRYYNKLLAELKNRLAIAKRQLDNLHTVNSVHTTDVAAQIVARIEQIEESEILEKEQNKLLTEFQSIFDDVPHINRLPTDVLAEIKLKDANQSIQTRTYSCPRRYRDAWKTLIQQHLQAGCICKSSTPKASPAFIIPKADPTALPLWVNDYRQLNKNTIPDRYPLPRVDDILADCRKGKIWGTIDMTNAGRDSDQVRSRDINVLPQGH